MLFLKFIIIIFYDEDNSSWLKNPDTGLRF